MVPRAPVRRKVRSMYGREIDLSHLHPAMRIPTHALIDAARAAQLPVRPYEGFRNPERQAELYARGRVAGVGEPGHHSTYAKAWESDHQHGFAVDWVFWENGTWVWPPASSPRWSALYHLVEQLRLPLVPLKFEKPHLGLEGFNARAILRGAAYPAGGDSSWEDNLNAAIGRWGQRPVKDRYGVVHPGAPPLLGGRPAESVPAGAVYDEARGLCELDPPDLPVSPET